MTYVIAQGCCNDASCVSVCPVDCIRPVPGDPDFLTAEQLYIDPVACIDCAACMWECPVGAIHDENDMPAEFDPFLKINADYFEANPLQLVQIEKKRRRVMPADRPALKVAVVGAGPAGCYAVDELSSTPGVQVSVFDRLPTPYGLVRAGVAPDHQKTKDVTKQFHQALRRSNVSCYFNVRLGEGVTIEDLLERHHAVVMAVGADADRLPGIPGDDLPGAHSAREFVAWYNGHPEHSDQHFDLTSERVVIVGNGNVALDVARVLASPPESFETTDMADHAVAALHESKVREVVVVARRGVLDAACTSPELMALERHESVDVVAEPAEVEDATGVESSRFGAGLKRDLFLRAAERTVTPGHRAISFRFGLTPAGIAGEDTVREVTFRRTTDGAEVPAEETFETSLVLFATGYRGSALATVPFDDDTATIPNIKGRVIDQSTSDPVPGLYCAGWVKRGATGVIGSNRVCSAETVGELLDDYESGRLTDPALLGDDLDAFVRDRQPEVVDFAGWLRIDAAERARGTGSGPVRPRDKFHAVPDMLAAARG